MFVYYGKVYSWSKNPPPCMHIQFDIQLTLIMCMSVSFLIHYYICDLILSMSFCKHVWGIITSDIKWGRRATFCSVGSECFFCIISFQKVLSVLNISLLYGIIRRGDFFAQEYIIILQLHQMSEFHL